MTRKLLFVAILTISTFISSFAKTTSLATPEKKASGIKSDKDWNFIMGKSKEFTERLIKSNIDFKNVELLKSKDLYLKLGYTELEFKTLVSEVTDAASRLIKNYNLEKYTNCKPCVSDIENKLPIYQKYGTYFRNTPSAIDKFYSGLATSPNNVVLAEEEGPGCGLAFYACVAVCAAAIPTFPIYLLCCAGCLCEFCSNPPSVC
jgi:hypothetical protein